MIHKSRLSIEEREQISILISKGHTYSFIAGFIGRSVSTIGREIYRNSLSVDYRAIAAHSQATKRQKLSHRREPKILSNESMRLLIHEKLKLLWSPYQISIWLKKTKGMNISHETIYQYIYVQSKGALKKELISFLRQRKPRRQSRKTDVEKRGIIPDMISIDQRPAEVADRSLPGHWEGDLIIGKDHKSAIGTLVERTTRYLLIVPLKSRDAVSVRKAFANKLKELPESLKKTLTYDRGKEMADHKKFTISTKMQVFFCDPNSPWQRGTNENTNGLIRGFFPKGTDFNEITNQKIRWVQEALNERPRETLDFKTPKEALNLLLLHQ